MILQVLYLWFRSAHLSQSLRPFLRWFGWNWTKWFQPWVSTKTKIHLRWCLKTKSRSLFLFYCFCPKRVACFFASRQGAGASCTTYPRNNYQVPELWGKLGVFFVFFLSTISHGRWVILTNPRHPGEHWTWEDMNGPPKPTQNTRPPEAWLDV